MRRRAAWTKIENQWEVCAKDVDCVSHEAHNLEWDERAQVELNFYQPQRQQGRTHSDMTCVSVDRRSRSKYFLLVVIRCVGGITEIRRTRK